MRDQKSRLYRLGGIAFAASGCSFFVKSVLELLTGPPPSNGSDIVAWAASHSALLAWTNEVLFFAVMFMVPAVVALYESLARTHLRHAVVGAGTMAVTIPVLCGLLIFHGRLAFPVYGIQVHTPDVAELVIAIYWGGMHAVVLLLAGGTFVVSLAMMQRPQSSYVAYLGFATAALDVVASYPDAIGPVAVLACGVFFAAWFVAVGIELYRSPVRVTPLTRRA